jgi:hypothetical protein
MQSAWTKEFDIANDYCLVQPHSATEPVSSLSYKVYQLKLRNQTLGLRECEVASLAHQVQSDLGLDDVLQTGMRRAETIFKLAKHGG